MALGADRNNVVRLVLRAALTQVGIGLALGILFAFLAGHYMADQLYGVRSYDPVSIATAIAVLSLAASIAGFIPARRAASIDPMKALRIE
jgi:ABC-type antimicrobial peptide transport system permease subunit